jgi:hypothetical protein
VTFSHTEDDVEYVLDVYCEALSILKQAIEENAVLEYLKGDPVQPVFRRV